MAKLLNKGSRDWFGEVVGPSNFLTLRRIDYGVREAMPTFGEVMQFIYSFTQKKDYRVLNQVGTSVGGSSRVDTRKDYVLVGNTGVLYTSDGIIFQDNPEIDLSDPMSRIDTNPVLMDKGSLIEKISYEKDGVSYSEDGTVRFVEYDFGAEPKTLGEFEAAIKSMGEISAEDTGLVALLNGWKNVEYFKEIFSPDTKFHFYPTREEDNSRPRVASMNIQVGPVYSLSSVPLDMNFPLNGISSFDRMCTVR